MIHFRNSSQGNTQNFWLILTTMSTYSQDGFLFFKIQMYQSSADFFGW